MKALELVLEFAILFAILAEIFLGWKWHKEARGWHGEEMKKWEEEIYNNK